MTDAVQPHRSCGLQKAAMPPKTTDKSSKPGLTVIQETVQTDITQLTIRTAGDTLYQDLHLQRLKRCRIDQFNQVRPAMSWDGSYDEKQPHWGSWHCHPDVPGLHCLLWDGMVSRKEAQRRGNDPPDSVVVAYEQWLLRTNKAPKGSSSSSS